MSASDCNGMGVATLGAQLVPAPFLAMPLYSYAEAARMLQISATTLHNWATGYIYKRIDGNTIAATPLVTSAEHEPGSRARLPFIGLAEAFMLRAFKEAGVPVQRIRPAIKSLEDNFGLRQALASERLMTDGAEVLYDFAHRSDDPTDREAVEGIIVVRNGQQVFRPVVKRYLKRIVYRDGWTGSIELPGYGNTSVIADPLLNGGFPTLRRRGVRVDDVLGRVRAGEPLDEIADDYRLTRHEVASLARTA